MRALDGFENNARPINFSSPRFFFRKGCRWLTLALHEMSGRLCEGGARVEYNIVVLFGLWSGCEHDSSAIES